jgi:translation elongation factor EF-G
VCLTSICLILCFSNPQKLIILSVIFIQKIVFQINIKAEVPLVEMFGYSTLIRSSTQGKGEFSMEYKQHEPVARDVQDNLIKLYAKNLEEPDED